jgi:hypothetical protein
MCVISCASSTNQREITLATTLIQASKLLTAAELDVFVAGRGDALKAMTPVQLRAKAKRARAARQVPGSAAPAEARNARARRQQGRP